MRAARIILSMALGFAGGLGIASVQAGAPGQPPPVRSAGTNLLPAATGGPDAAFLDRFRVSALITGGKNFRVGFVDSTSGKAYLVAQGDPFFGFELEAMDYAAERVILRKGKSRYGLSLRDDPDVRVVVASAPPLPASASNAASPVNLAEKASGKIKTLEEFLAEHPDLQATESARFDFPTNVPPVQGLGEGIESFLKAHPELADNVQTSPVTGLGPGIEAVMQDNPELLEKARAAAKGEGESMEKALERMARESGQPQPTISTNPTTFEDFVRMHAPAGR